MDKSVLNVVYFFTLNISTKTVSTSKGEGQAQGPLPLNTLPHIYKPISRSGSDTLLRHWLPIRARIDFKIATLTYNTLTFGHPAYLRQLFSPYQPSRLLRSGKQLLLTVPRAKLATGQRAFSYSSPVIWNAIPLSVRDAPSVSTFKRRLKSFCFNSQLLRVINFRMYVCNGI